MADAPKPKESRVRRFEPTDAPGSGPRKTASFPGCRPKKRDVKAEKTLTDADSSSRTALRLPGTTSDNGSYVRFAPRAIQSQPRY